MPSFVCVSKLACIDEYIESLPFNYKSIIGERGAKLSGGQKQRIGIARALYRESQMLVFDESTSALDINSEERILNNLDKAYKEKIILMVSHRVSSLRDFDKIYVLDKGRIINEGKFSQLIENCTLFRTLLTR